MSLTTAVETAALSIGRLDAALDGHPLRKAWEHRTRLAAAVQAAAWNGQAVLPDRLAGILAGVRYPTLEDYMAEHKALVFFDFLASLSNGERLVADAEDDAQWSELTADLTAFREVVEANDTASALSAVADAAWAMRRSLDSRPGILHAAIPTELARRGATRAGVVLGLAAYPPLTARPAWQELFLDGLAKAAEEGRARLQRLTVTAEEWRQRLGSRQKNSRLPPLVAAALCHPRLTPVGVQAWFGTRTVTGEAGKKEEKPAISLPGASKLLDELVALRILNKGADRRGSHHLFLAADLGVGVVDRAQPARHPQDMVLKIGGQHLDQLLDRIDVSIRRTTALLARHGRLST